MIMRVFLQNSKLWIIAKIAGRKKTLYGPKLRSGPGHWGAAHIGPRGRSVDLAQGAGWRQTERVHGQQEASGARSPGARDEQSSCSMKRKQRPRRGLGGRDVAGTVAAWRLIRSRGDKGRRDWNGRGAGSTRGCPARCRRQLDEPEDAKDPATERPERPGLDGSGGWRRRARSTASSCVGTSMAAGERAGNAVLRRGEGGRHGLLLLLREEHRERERV